VEACFSLRRDVLGWRQSKSTGDTVRKEVVVRQFAVGNNGVLAGEDPALDTTNTNNNLDMKREPVQKELHRMAKIHNFVDMWQGSQNLCATQKKSRAQNKQLTAVGYISDTEDIIKASRSNFQYDCAAALKLSERSPVPPALSANDLHGGRTQVLNIRRIKRIDRHPAETDVDNTPESVSDTENWLDWNGDLDNPNDSEDNWEADNESKMELNNGVRDSEPQEQRDVSSAPNVPVLISPTRGSKINAQNMLITVGTMETRRSKGMKKM